MLERDRRSLASAPTLPRRGFLTGLVTLPLVGGGVTLIGKPAAAVPLVQAAALPALDDPRQRARYAWEAFSAAMRDLTPDAHGWRVRGACETQAFRSVAPMCFLDVASVHYHVDVPGLSPRGLVVEHHEQIDLGEVGDATLGGRHG